MEEERRGEEEEADGHKSRTCILSKLVRKKKEGHIVRVTEEQEQERFHSHHVFISPLSSRLPQPLRGRQREVKKERDLTRFKQVVLFPDAFQMQCEAKVSACLVVHQCTTR